MDKFPMTTTRSPGRIIPRAFPGIKPEEVEQIIAHSRVKAYPAGTVLCKEDAYERTFYMILSGDMEVTKVINHSETRLLKTLTAGDFFGEMALIHNAPRAATVACKTNAIVLELDKEGFEKIFQKSPSMAVAMVREISNRLRQNDQMAIEDLRMRARELADAYQQLAEQEQARREFLTNAAHELRTPLMAASGYLQLLQQGVMTGDQLTAAVDTVARNVSQIVTLVNDILFLQEIELVLPDFDDVDLNGIVRSVADQYRAKAEAHGILLRVQAGSVPPVHGDAKSLERALTALVDNAIKFSPRGGEVGINLSRLNSKVALAVKDQGIGIAPDVKPRIFDRFYHLERNDGDLFGGLGLGLSITRQVIKQHEGILDVESEPGKGSTFTIILHAKNNVGS